LGGYTLLNEKDQKEDTMWENEIGKIES
jgi:hypothetical protein